MSERPYVTLSCAMSIDGHLDGVAPGRLAMSNAADLDRVDEVRSRNDAIMVGASTVRRDDPRLLIRSEERKLRRIASGLPSSPVKVTVTSSGELPADAAFFTAGEVEKIVYCPGSRARRLESRPGGAATIAGLGERVVMGDVLDDLGDRGIRSLMVEGGGNVLTQFLAGDHVDELHLVIAPFFVGEDAAPRVVGAAAFPWTDARRAVLADTRQIGDVVLLRYALSDRFGELSRHAQGAVSAGRR
jgi:5-amino-6-(5-phosphoribosylamino)uracil reductase